MISRFYVEFSKFFREQTAILRCRNHDGRGRYQSYSDPYGKCEFFAQKYCALIDTAVAGSNAPNNAAIVAPAYFME